MAKLHFFYASMGAGKSAALLQTEWNYRERGMKARIYTAAIDDRYGQGRVSSRLGLSAPAELFHPGDDLFETFGRAARRDNISAMLFDEAQFLTRAQVLQLAACVDKLDLPVLCYGLRTDYRGELFEGSAALLGLADRLQEMRSICHCGRKATMVLRLDARGEPTLEGAQVQIGGNESYQPVCRKHWSAAHEDRARTPRAALPARLSGAR